MFVSSRRERILRISNRSNNLDYLPKEMRHLARLRESLHSSRTRRVQHLPCVGGKSTRTDGWPNKRSLMLPSVLLQDPVMDNGVQLDSRIRDTPCAIRNGQRLPTLESSHFRDSERRDDSNAGSKRSWKRERKIAVVRMK